MPETIVTLPYRLKHALHEIEAEFGVQVAIKDKSLLKFGYNPALSAGVAETVWNQGGDETYATGNTIDRISSSSTSDTSVTLRIEGHRLDNGGFDFVVQEVALNGQTPASLSIPIARVSRAFIVGTGNFAGDVYVFESGGTVTAGVPQEAARIHMRIRQGNNQSEKCATTFSRMDYFLVSELFGWPGRQNSASMEFSFQVRVFGEGFRTRFEWVANTNGGASSIHLDPMLVIPANADCRIRVVSSANTTTAYAAFNGYFALRTE